MRQIGNATECFIQFCMLTGTIVREWLAIVWDIDELQ